MPATPFSSSSSDTTALVCFPCRKVSSRGVHYGVVMHEYPERDPICPTCNGQMHNIGDKLKVPKGNNNKAWAQFYDQVTAPGYRPCRFIDEKRHEENLHWEACRLWKTVEGRPTPDACERCVEIAKRVPEDERSRWEKIRLSRKSTPYHC